MPLDFIPNLYNPRNNHPARGAFCRTLSNVGWRRRPLLRLVTAGSGGPGQPSAGITTGCLQWLDVAATKGGGSRPGRQGPQKALPGRAPGSTAPGTEKPQVERRTATRLLALGAARRKASGWWSRRSALHPLALLVGARGSLGKVRRRSARGSDRACPHADAANVRIFSHKRG